jgi:hypothetical protein
MDGPRGACLRRPAFLSAFDCCDNERDPGNEKCQAKPGDGTVLFTSAKAAEADYDKNYAGQNRSFHCYSSFRARIGAPLFNHPGISAVLAKTNLFVCESGLASALGFLPHQVAHPKRADSSQPSGCIVQMAAQADTLVF